MCHWHFLTFSAHDLCTALEKCFYRHFGHRHKVHQWVEVVALSSESWHLLQFNKFPVWELPFSTWIIDRSNLIHKGGNLISWLFNEWGLVSLGSAECGWWRGRTLKWMREHRQKTLWTCNTGATIAVNVCNVACFFGFCFALFFCKADWLSLKQSALSVS